MYPIILMEQSDKQVDSLRLIDPQFIASSFLQ